MRKILFCLILVSHSIFSQDPEFAQYYASPLLINPAFTGDVDCYRVGTSSRLQWTGLPGGPFNTVAIFADLNHSSLNSGFGFMAMRDGVSGSRITSYEIDGLYSYLVPVSKQVNFRLGLQGGLVSRTINYSDLLFGDQFSGTTLTSSTTADPVVQYDRTHYGDFSAGILMFSEKTYWVGLSAHHLNQPRQNFYIVDSKIPIKFSLHGGYCFYYNKSKYKNKKNEVQIIPTFLYKSQGKFDQFDLGVYFIKSQLLAGVWYRGIFFKQDDGIRNNDAVSAQLGVKSDKFSFIYSYDITTSRLNIRNTLGSHELSILYKFCSRWPKKKKPIQKKLPCPDFF